MNGKIHVVMAADQGYSMGLEIAKASMVASCSAPERLEFHLYDDKAEVVSRILTDFGTYKGSTMAFVRLYLGELLPDVDWVVYSDVDTLWYRDVVELWGERDETKILQWVRDIPATRIGASAWHKRINPDFNPQNYGCSGVMLLNLKRMRSSGFLGRAISFNKEHGLPTYVDQDILNALCHDDCGFLPPWWDVLIPDPANTQAAVTDAGGTAIKCVLHLTGVGRCFSRPYDGSILQYRFWEHVARGTPFHRPGALPFCLGERMTRFLFPFATPFFRDRVRRFFAYRWLFGKMNFRGTSA